MFFLKNLTNHIKNIFYKHIIVKRLTSCQICSLNAKKLRPVTGICYPVLVFYVFLSNNTFGCKVYLIQNNESSVLKILLTIPSIFLIELMTYPDRQRTSGYNLSQYNILQNIKNNMYNSPKAQLGKDLPCITFADHYLFLLCRNRNKKDSCGHKHCKYQNSIRRLLFSIAFSPNN